MSSIRQPGLIHIETGPQFRRTNATIAQVVEAFAQLVAAAPDTPAAANAKRVVALLGHSLPEKP